MRVTGRKYFHLNYFFPCIIAPGTVYNNEAHTGTKMCHFNITKNVAFDDFLTTIIINTGKTHRNVQHLIIKNKVCFIQE
jgi:hypothetical protein